MKAAAIALLCGASAVAQPPARVSHEKLHSTLWVQHSAEYSGLTLQAYRNAREMLDRALKDKKWTAAVEQTQRDFRRLPPAIVLDVDETVLDNTPSQSRMIRAGENWSQPIWREWVLSSAAGAVPGALEFTQYAASRGVTCFFITNREVEYEAATRANLERLHFPLDAHVDTIYTKGERPGWDSDKSSRRALVASRYRILLLIGDDLGDFAPMARSSVQNRQKIVKDHAADWGTKWIVIPNPMYGSWEDALYNYDRSLDDAATLRRKYDALIAK